MCENIFETVEDTTQEVLNTLPLNLDLRINHFPTIVNTCLNVTDESVSCRPCYEHLQRYLSFVNNCLNMEEKAKQYCEPGKNKKELTNLLHFAEKSMPNYGDDHDNLNALNVKEQCYERYIKGEKIKVEVRKEDPVEIEEKQLHVKEDSVNLSTEENRSCQELDFLECPKATEEFSGAAEYNCNTSSIRISHKEDAKPYDKTHGNMPEVTMYKCNSCKYQTRYKYHLRRHELIHKDVTEVKMYKCNICEYQSKQKESLQRHIVNHHTDTSDVKMYMCNMCEYRAKHRYYLQQHMLTHKDISEVASYKCNVCDYQSKRRWCLQQHMLTHKDAFEVTMYTCNMCEYQTKLKSCLRRHILTHKEESGLTYACNMIQLKSSLQQNKPTRNDAYEVPMDNAKCSISENASDNAPEVTMYTCGKCDYQTKHKQYLPKHMLNHKDISEITTYKCNMCEHQTKRKQYLREHMLSHKNPSEITLCKCVTCGFQTKHKKYLRRHMLTHKDPSEVTMYKCKLCEYQSKYKRHLQRHMKIHEKCF